MVKSFSDREVKTDWGDYSNAKKKAKGKEDDEYLLQYFRVQGKATKHPNGRIEEFKRFGMVDNLKNLLTDSTITLMEFGSVNVYKAMDNNEAQLIFVYWKKYTHPTIIQKAMEKTIPIIQVTCSWFDGNKSYWNGEKKETCACVGGIKF